MNVNEIKNFIKENALLVFAILYLLSPIDLIPDLLPVLGIVDDLFVLILTLIYKYHIYKKNKKIKSTE